VKRILFILFLVIAINFSAPATETLVLRQRHLIENTSGINKRDVPADELLRQKIVSYARMEILIYRILITDAYHNGYYNTS
jgi:hypothetical protein